MTHSYETSAVAACAAIRQRDVSTQDLTSRLVARIAARNGEIGAVTDLLADQAMETARNLDVRIAKAAPLPALAGLPVIIKENCDTIGAVCSAGLEFRKDHKPTTDSWITARLRDAGAVVLGVAASDPGAFSVRTPQVTHPFDPSLTVGGSSGGSAAALAAGFCLGAIGTDTGGSIRIPSACCGTVGLKPTFASVPMDGIFPLVQSLDHVGPMARSVEDTRLLWDAINPNRGEPKSQPGRIGYDPRWVEIADGPIRAAFDLALVKFQERGVEVAEVSLPDLDTVAAMHGRIFLVEAARYHLAHHAEHREAYPQIARDWFEIAQDISPETYDADRSTRAKLTAEVDEILTRVDAIILPTLPVARPPKIGDTLVLNDIEHDYTMALVRLTCLFDHTGHPVLTLPVPGSEDPLSSSLQIVGGRFREDSVFDAAGLIVGI